MASFDEEIDECWPDEDHRRARREKLHKNLDAFLDAGFIKSDGGWALVEEPHVSELYDLLGEIIDLKVERDPDGDRTIELALCNRRYRRMSVVYETYQDRSGNPSSRDDLLVQLAEGQREVEYAMAVASRMATSAAGALNDIAFQIRQERAEREKITMLETALSELPFEEARTRLLDEMKPYRLSDNKTKDIFSPAQAIMARRFPEQLAHDVNTIMEIMAEYNSDDEPDFGERVRTVRVTMGKIWGEAFTRNADIIARGNALYDEGRRIRKERRDRANNC